MQSKRPSPNRLGLLLTPPLTQSTFSVCPSLTSLGAQWESLRLSGLGDRPYRAGARGVDPGDPDLRVAAARRHDPSPAPWRRPDLRGRSGPSLRGRHRRRRPALPASGSQDRAPRSPEGDHARPSGSGGAPAPGRSRPGVVMPGPGGDIGLERPSPPPRWPRRSRWTFWSRC